MVIGPAVHYGEARRHAQFDAPAGPVRRAAIRGVVRTERDEIAVVHGPQAGMHERQPVGDIVAGSLRGHVDAHREDPAPRARRHHEGLLDLAGAQLPHLAHAATLVHHAHAVGPRRHVACQLYRAAAAFDPAQPERHREVARRRRPVERDEVDAVAPEARLVARRQHPQVAVTRLVDEHARQAAVADLVDAGRGRHALARQERSRGGEQGREEEQREEGSSHVSRWFGHPSRRDRGPHADKAILFRCLVSSCLVLVCSLLPP